MTDRFQPFEFLLTVNKKASMEERIEAIADIIRIIAVNLARVSEYCDNRINEIYDQLNHVSSRLNVAEANIEALQQRFISNPEKNNASVPALIKAPPPPPQQEQKRVTSAQDVRNELMTELRNAFKKRSQSVTEE